MSKYVQRTQKIISDDGFLQRIEEDVKIMLKRCPFCGGKAHHQTALDEDELTKDIIKCEECNAQTGLYDELDEAVDAWNQRT